jgi:hypothetical protein
VEAEETGYSDWAATNERLSWLTNIQDAIKEYLAAVEGLLEGATIREIDVQA